MIINHSDLFDLSSKYESLTTCDIYFTESRRINLGPTLEFHRFIISVAFYKITAPG